MLTTISTTIILSFLATITSTTASYAYNTYPYALPAAYSAVPALRTAAPAYPAGPALLSAAPVPVARAAPFIAAPALRTAYPPPLAAAPAVFRSAPVAAPLAAPLPAPLPAPLAAPLAAAPLAAAPVVAPVAKLDYADTYPQYRFAYDIQDALTGDSKTQEEIREGGVVKGRYSLLEADGSRRTVNYYADPLNGFNAVIQKDVPVVAAAPVIKAAAPAVVAL